MLRKLFSKKPHPETVLKSNYDALQVRYDALVEQQKRVTKERNDIGTLLLDCLSLLNDITISKRQNALIAERETLVERARELGYLPKGEEEQEEVSKP